MVIPCQAVWLGHALCHCQWMTKGTRCPSSAKSHPSSRKQHHHQSTAASCGCDNSRYKSHQTVATTHVAGWQLPCKQPPNIHHTQAAGTCCDRCSGKQLDTDKEAKSIANCSWMFTGMCVALQQPLTSAEGACRQLLALPPHTFRCLTCVNT
jgi:hypothetical protein